VPTSANQCQQVQQMQQVQEVQQTDEESRWYSSTLLQYHSPPSWLIVPFTCGKRYDKTGGEDSKREPECWGKLYCTLHTPLREVGSSIHTTTRVITIISDNEINLMCLKLSCKSISYLVFSEIKKYLRRYCTSA
jgi:hypothetical protein